MQPSNALSVYDDIECDHLLHAFDIEEDAANHTLDAYCFCQPEVRVEEGDYGDKFYVAYHNTVH